MRRRLIRKYDLNNPRDLTKYYTEEQIKAMSDEEKLDTLNSLLNNFCVSDTYEPGSTFKPFCYFGRVGNRCTDWGRNVYMRRCPPRGDHDIHCSNRDGHGSQTLKQSLENSCNVALMQIGEALGAGRIYKISGIIWLWRTDRH